MTVQELQARIEKLEEVLIFLFGSLDLEDLNLQMAALNDIAIKARPKR